MIPDDKYLRLIEEELKILKALRFKTLSGQNEKLKAKNEEEKEAKKIEEKSEEILLNKETMVTSVHEIDLNPDKLDKEDDNLDPDKTCSQNEHLDHPLLSMKISNTFEDRKHINSISSKSFCFPHNEPLFHLIERDICLLNENYNPDNE